MSVALRYPIFRGLLENNFILYIVRTRHARAATQTCDRPVPEASYCAVGAHGPRLTEKAKHSGNSEQVRGLLTGWQSNSAVLNFKVALIDVRVIFNGCGLDLLMHLNHCLDLLDRFDSSGR